MEPDMKRFRELVREFARRIDAQDLIEYALLAAFIGLAAAASTGLVGLSLDDWYTAVSGSIALLRTTL
jgi:Flp pilus assembly pilin Flp